MSSRQTGRWAGAVAAAAVVLVTTSPSWSLEPQAHAVGAGLIVTGGGNWIDQPADQTVTIGDRTGQPVSIGDYPGFAGPSYGFGLAVETRLFGFAGIELDVIRSRDIGQAHFFAQRGASEASFTLEIAQDAWHVPLLFKGMLPTEIARPMLLVGPEFVFPELAEATITDGYNLFDAQLAAHSESYLMITWGGGAEFDLPVDVLDLRLAATLRASATPGVGDERMDRASYSGTDLHRLDAISYKTTWQYQLLGALAASVYF